MQMVRFFNGRFNINGQPVSVDSLEFPLVKEYHRGTSANYVTVDGSYQPGFPNRNIRIICDGPEDFEYINNEECDQQHSTMTSTTPTETDEQIVERLRNRFQILEDMTRAAKRGDVRAMIVSGPPGVGKSFGVERVLSKHDLLADIAGDDRLRKYEIVKGAMSPLGLYCKLFDYSDRDNVIVFDDCDSILQDDLSLNILKAALDSKKTRTIHWNTDSYKLRTESIPDRFEFRGSVIFITNIKFDHIKSKKLKDHLEALESRCHYIDLTIDSEREKMLRIKQIIGDGMLDAYGFGTELVESITEYVDNNKKRFRELSLRTVIKVADLCKAFPDSWEMVAETTLVKH